MWLYAYQPLQYLPYRQFVGRQTPTYQQQDLMAREFRENGQLHKETDKESC
jgi:hypothetical protein